MADKIRITPAELTAQAKKLHDLDNLLGAVFDKTKSTLDMLEDAMSGRFTSGMTLKGNKLIRNMRTLGESLRTGAKVADQCAKTYENADKVLRDTIGDTLPDEIKTSPVSTQKVMSFASPLKTLKVTSGYGPRNLYGTFHHGTDFKASVGTPVMAVTSGTIISNDNQSSGGKVIYMLGDDGYVYEFAHLSQRNFKAGDKVNAGDVIALSGNTGSASTGAHLHLGVYKASEALNKKGKVKWNIGSDGYYYIKGSVDPMKHLASYGIK